MRIEAAGLMKTYATGEKPAPVLCQASLRIDPGETIGLLGESGCGKSTLGLILAGLLRPDAGQVLADGQPISMPYRGKLRTDIQILFQHPEVSFNPRLTLLQSMKEPHGIHRRPFSQKALLDEMEAFGLRGEHLARYPHELSGGELQRAALIRLLSVNPGFIVLDEPTSMLDAISQAQIVHMLRGYQAQRGIAYLFITHSEALAFQCCHRLYRIEPGQPPFEIEKP